MMELDVRVPSKAFIETLGRWLAGLEYLEATGAATPDTCEVLTELHELLDKLRGQGFRAPRSSRPTM